MVKQQSGREKCFGKEQEWRGTEVKGLRGSSAEIPHFLKVLDHRHAICRHPTLQHITSRSKEMEKKRERGKETQH